MGSRGKKKPSSPARRRVMSNPMKALATQRTEEQIAEQARVEFVARAEAEGHLFAPGQDYVAFGPPVECWSNAWAYSRAHGLRYAEGVAAMPDGWHAHAWCVDRQGRVVEPTINYQHAREYRGWVLNGEGERAVAALLDEGPRASFLEAGIASGVAEWEAIVARFCGDPGPLG